MYASYISGATRTIIISLYVVEFFVLIRYRLRYDATNTGTSVGPRHAPCSSWDTGRVGVQLFGHFSKIMMQPF